ncbi:MAG: hypothetical protein WBQ72_03825 [Terriglobales bacterium]|jgi:hypothetical protein
MTQNLPPSSEDLRDAFEILRPIYQALVCEFVIEVPDCPLPADSSDIVDQNEAAQIQAWFADVDGDIQVHQLRQFLQTTPLASEPVLRSLLWHHLHKPVKSPSDRDKIDFLLVQYFSLCTPSPLDDAAIDLNCVAGVLAPVLGPQTPALPGWLAPLESLVQSAHQCARLSELLHSGVLEQGRKLKTQAGDGFYDPAAMVAFARFSFMIRRIFFRLMHGDLNAIMDGLHALEVRGTHSIDCRRAQFSAEEPTARLRMICQSWKVMFHAEYSSGHPLRMLVDLRSVVEDALGTAPLAHAAAAASRSRSAPEK